MPVISAALMKELRERTGADMMVCKQALIDADGSIDQAYDSMLASGAVKATRTEIAADGVIAVQRDADYGYMVEVNCQTEFVARDGTFVALADRVAKAALHGRITDIDKLKQMFEEERAEFATEVGENISIRRVAVLEGAHLADYIHSRRIAVLVSTLGASPETSKQIAMHIAATKPLCINPGEFPTKVIENERQMQLQISSGKPKDTADKMLEESLAKLRAELSLITQRFLFDKEKTVGQVLKEAGADLLSFLRCEVGETL